MKFGTGVLHKNLSSRREFNENGSVTAVHHLGESVDFKPHLACFLTIISKIR